MKRVTEHDKFVINVRLKDRAGLHFIHVRADQIVQIGRMEQFPQSGQDEKNEQFDAKGKLALPPLIDSHIHYDSALTAGEPRWNKSGTLPEAIALLAARRETADAADYKERALQVMQWQAAQGIQYARVHTDVSGPDLIGLEVMLELKQEMAKWIDIQIVAFPQLGLTSDRRYLELMEEALKMGADVVGGMPQLEMTKELGIASIKQVFDLAEKYDRMVDFHCDETDDEQSRFVETVAAEAFFREMGSRTTASHVTAMHSYNNAYAAKLIGTLQQTGINIVSNPLSNISLQGRYDSYPVRRGITRIKSLLEAGISVSLGHDNFMDPFYTLGTGGMLNVLNMALHACHLLSYEDIVRGIDLITLHAARTLQLGEKYDIAPGTPAHFIIMDAPNVFECVRTQAPVLYSFRHGELIVQNKPADIVLLDPVTKTSKRICFTQQRKSQSSELIN